MFRPRSVGKGVCTMKPDPFMPTTAGRMQIRCAWGRERAGAQASSLRRRGARMQWTAQRHCCRTALITAPAAACAGEAAGKQSMGGQASTRANKQEGEGMTLKIHRWRRGEVHGLARQSGGGAQASKAAGGRGMHSQAMKTPMPAAPAKRIDFGNARRKMARRPGEEGGGNKSRKKGGCG